MKDTTEDCAPEGAAPVSHHRSYGDVSAAYLEAYEYVAGRQDSHYMDQVEDAAEEFRRADRAHALRVGGVLFVGTACFVVWAVVVLWVSWGGVR